MFQVIAHFQNGQVLKGLTADFIPAKKQFHLLAADSCPGTHPTAIALPDLKALFFVRHLDGNPAHEERKAFDPTNLTPGRRIRVVFMDGEIIVGFTRNYHPGRRGFFLLPADQRSNNERCFVVTTATRTITLL